MTRLAGCTIPLFSLRTRRSWGIGQISDLVPTAKWLLSGGMRLLQILPPYELCEGETSPYGARTAFGIDPVYIDLADVEDLGDPEALLDEAGRRELARLRDAARVDYAAVRALKAGVLRQKFAQFYEHEWLRGTARGQELRTFIERERDWEDDLALYVALRESHQQHAWDLWPEGERNRDPETLAAKGQQLERRILEHQYGQWIAHRQWQRARVGLAELRVELMGDLPFVVGHESADVWSHAHQFRKDVTLGAPPDAFSPEGQDWGLPAYDWAAMDADNLGWLVARTRHAAKLYDRFRLDHVVGYFRMFVTPKKGHISKGTFDPATEAAQIERGRGLLRRMADEAHPAKLIAEDLGKIPDFVREALRDLEMPGYRVIPWERDYVRHMYRTPDEFQEVSVASWSTHDTAPIVSWWGELQPWEREGLSEVAGIEPKAGDEERWLGLMRSLLHAGSDLTLVLSAEILGEDVRINTPGTVGPENWTYRLPKPVEDLERDPIVGSRMGALLALAKSSGRIE
ncbi:4-alpha-glucanotransferase [Pendulispora rubella]|uniref:4-alpha-glucanotransferase n=1 Tax=Pendulispora rubella TaxID=2741070 RepID=A0ABZ2LBG0_9BACT